MVKVLIFVGLWHLHYMSVCGDAASDFNLINNDGSFSFGASSNDRGGFFHSARRTSNNVERGRFGSRNPSNGRVEETVYTAGPRGFRARGPNIHRKMDLSQVPRGPIGAPGDPLADPYDDPSYSFSFRTAEHQRREDADSAGRVRGLYSYIDDVGETHSVRYAAGANTGFEVLNAVPDAPSYVKYNAPLFKADRRTRGRVAYERGPGRQYKFITSGPDQRRSESTGPDGITRGSYSYLDDKGIQRTIQYIAGPGIGYRVVQSTTGPGTHLIPRPAVPEFGIRFPESNDIVDDEGSGFKPGSGGGGRPFGGGQNNRISGGGGDDVGADKRDRDPLLSNGIDVLDQNNANDNDDAGFDRGTQGGSGFNRGSPSTGGQGGSNTQAGGSNVRGNSNFRPNSSNLRPGGGSNFNQGGSGSTRGPSGGNNNNNNDDDDGDYDGGFNDNRRPSNNNRNKNTINGGGVGSVGGGDNSIKFNRNKPNRDNAGGGGSLRGGDDNYDDNDDRDGSGPAGSGSPSGPNSGSNDWRKKARQSTIIKNVGSWYVGLPPGVAVRAHVQNIDLLPAGQGVESPGQAARRDDRARLLKIF